MHYNCGRGLIPISWARADLGLDGYLCCPGPSLDYIETDLRGRGRMVFALNTAYPRVMPDIWIGMDKAECYDRNLWYEPFPKICRGGLQEMTLGGECVKDFPQVYWASVEQTEQSMFNLRNHQDLFVWHKHTLGTALHIMVWMGVRKFHFVGCDMGGSRDYWDDRKLTDEQRKHNRTLYGQQVDWLRKWSEEARQWGMDVLSCTPDSPINEYMPYKDVYAALNDSEASHVVKDTGERVHALETVERRKLGVVIPTRGDRPQFVAQCQEMMARQTKQPDGYYLIDYKPIKEGNDQRDRVRRGVEKAKADGMTHILIVEDDDYYPPEYIETMWNAWRDEDLIGSAYYQAYHLKRREYLTFRVCMDCEAVPLHCTGFTVDAYERFVDDGKGNLDDALSRWGYQHARYRLLLAPLVVSIKHGVGCTGGGLHDTFNHGVPDPEMKWLKRQVDDPELITFYQYGTLDI